MPQIWFLWLVTMMVAVVSLARFQHATTAVAQTVTGAAAMISGLAGLLLLAVVVF